MPRLNQGRSVRVEANLARRIAYEREQRGLSYEALADAMTKVGCAINASSIYKIEKGDPPRRISVDELAALGEVFQEPLTELLVEMELIHHRKAHELIESLSELRDVIDTAAVQAFAALSELFDLEDADVELAEYVEHHVQSRRGKIEAALEQPADVGENAALVAEATTLRMLHDCNKLWRGLTDAAQAWSAVRRGTWSDRLHELMVEQVEATRDAEQMADELSTLEREIRKARADG